MEQPFALDASFWWEWTHTHIKCILHRSRNTSQYPPLSHTSDSKALWKQTPNLWTRGHNKVQWFFGGGPNTPSP
jgi:hypothetical protein